jgi:hypothetical protein
MNRNKKIFLAVCAFLLALIVVVSVWNVPPKSQGLVGAKPATPLITQGDPVPGVYACAQCIANNCYQGTCNLSCEYFPNGCQTIVAGFFFNELEKDKKPTAEPLFSGVPGVPLRTVRADLAALGVEVGDVLTHINDEYIGGNLERLTELSASLKKGDVLLLWRKGERVTVTL